MQNLQNYSVRELGTKEAVNTNGGYWWLPATALAIYLFDNRDRFVEGVKKGLGLNE